MSSQNVPREQGHIQKVIDTIWWPDGRVRCPVCSAPMNQTDGYEWECDTGYCPVETLAFNEMVHSYGVERKPSKPYRPDRETVKGLE